MGQLTDIFCHIILSYSAMILILFLPFSITLLQVGSAFIEKPLVSQEIRAQYTWEAESIMLSGKVLSPIYNADEVKHLFDVRKVFFGGVIATVIVLLLFFFVHLNRQRLLLLKSSRWLFGAAILNGILTLITAFLFPYFFLLLHVILFPQGNFVFPDTSPLIQAFPLAFWWLAYLILQVGVILLLSIQAMTIRKQEVV
jgi:hypothetical protein